MIVDYPCGFASTHECDPILTAKGTIPLKLNKSLLLGITVFVSVYAALDVGGAQLCKQFCGDLLERNHRQKFRQKDDIVHHKFQPNVSAVETWGGRSYPLYTNSLGFRDAAPREVAQETTKHRVMLMGDSFTEGSGVTWPESFAGILQDRLKGENVEILNSAVSSYAPAVYLALANEIVVNRKIDVDAVLIFLDQSDVKDSASWYRVDDQMRVYEPGKSSRSRRVFSRPGDWLKDNSLTVSFIYLLRDFISYQLKLRQISSTYGVDAGFFDVELWDERVGRVDQTDWCDSSTGAPDWTENGVRFATKYMDLAVELLKSRGIEVGLVVYPWPSNILRPVESRECATYWLDWAADKNIPALSLFDAFRESEDPWLDVKKFYIPLDVHWNKVGHALVAEQVLREFPDLIEGR